jgi:hypothetical protein
MATVVASYQTVYSGGRQAHSISLEHDPEKRVPVFEKRIMLKHDV